MIDENIYNFFRNIHNYQKETEFSKDGISVDKLDMFFDTLTDSFAFILQNGLAAFDVDKVKLGGVHTAEIFKIGMSCVQNGIDNTAIAIIMDFLYDLVRAESVSAHELFEIKLLTHIIPMIQMLDVDKFRFLLSTFHSMQRFSIFEDKLLTAAGREDEIDFC